MPARTASTCELHLEAAGVDAFAASNASVQRTIAEAIPAIA